MTTNMYRRLAVASAALMGLALVVGCSSQSSSTSTGNSSSASGKGFVAVLLPDAQTARWEQQDLPFITAAVAKYSPTLSVKGYNAQGDPAAQLSQAETALTLGAKVLVVVAVDQFQAAQIVTLAQKQSVPVIAYDRLIQNAPVAYYISVDGVTVGQLQGQWLADHTKTGDNIAVINGSTDDANAHLFNQGYMSVLKPLFASGKRHLAGEAWTTGWVPATAQQEMEQILTRKNNNVQGVLSANDGMAGGIIQALKSQKLAGKVPVTGLDGTMASDQSILQGLQSMTVWRSLKQQADLAAQIVAALIKGEKPPVTLFNGKIKNNGQVDVPWAAVTAQVITASNMDLLIKDGSIDKSALCQGIKPGTGPC